MHIYINIYIHTCICIYIHKAADTEELDEIMKESNELIELWLWKCVPSKNDSRSRYIYIYN
jgi:hypothetical protein